jgi:hypothetical protein
MTIDEWLADACADADRRGLADLKPLLASLADATKALRSAGWEDAGRVPENLDASGPPPPPAEPEAGAAR